MQDAEKEMVDQTVNHSNDAHESMQQMLILRKILFPKSITTLSKARPCALWMVTAQANFKGSRRREHWTLHVNQVQRYGVIGTVP